VGGSRGASEEGAGGGRGTLGGGRMVRRRGRGGGEGGAGGGERKICRKGGE